MPSTSLTIQSARTLDRFGAASRCLLRLRENQGNPRLPDADFLLRYEARFPHWAASPGLLDAEGLALLAREMGISPSTAQTNAYPRVLQAHRFGYAAIIATGRAPLQEEQSAAWLPHWMVLEQMDEDGFEVWCPFESGGSDILPRVPHVWWDRWLCTAHIFHTAPTSAT